MGGGVVCINVVCLQSVSLYVAVGFLVGGAGWGAAIDVCLQSGIVCNAVWQRIIDSQSQSQMLFRKHKACMPGHIPLCLSVQRDGPSGGLKRGDCDGIWARDQKPSHDAEDLSFFSWFFLLLLLNASLWCGIRWPAVVRADLFAVGLCNCHQVQMTPADDIVSYSPNHGSAGTGGCWGWTQGHMYILARK